MTPDPFDYEPVVRSPEPGIEHFVAAGMDGAAAAASVELLMRDIACAAGQVGAYFAKGFTAIGNALGNVARELGLEQRPAGLPFTIPAGTSLAKVIAHIVRIDGGLSTE